MVGVSTALLKEDAEPEAGGPENKIFKGHVLAQELSAFFVGTPKFILSTKMSK